MLAPKTSLRIFVTTLFLCAGIFSPALAQVTGSLGSSGSVQPTTASAQFKSGFQLVEKGEYAQAYAMARGFSNPLERRAVQWAAIYYGKGEIDAQSVQRFAQDAPDLMSSGLFRTRLEQALLDTQPSANDVISLLGGQMPNTIDAQILLGNAYIQTGQVDRGLGILRQVWVSNFLDTDQEQAISSRFGGQLGAEAHWKRAVHLMMHDRVRGAERLSGFLNSGQNALVAARAAVARKQNNARAKLDQVPSAYRTHPVYHFSKGQYLRRAGQYSAAVDAFNAVGAGALPDAAEWWYERRYLTRQLVSRKQYIDAYRLAAFYQEGPEGRVVDANLHAGWIALHFLDKPSTAVSHFEKMVSLSTLESSITKANYWLGRAHARAGDSNSAKAAFAKAAAYPTSYYGILAAYRLGKTELDLRPMPNPDGRIGHFENMQLVRIIKLMASNGYPKMAEPLVTRLVYSVSDGGDMVLTARLAQSLDAHNLAILMADIAAKRGMPMDVFNYPRDGIASINKLDADPAAVYAVARQESKFDFDVTSRAGAKGLMQLMPGTAKETAGRMGVAYSPARLTTDPEYNAMLGARYLKQQLARYDNSLILAAGAYNAGAGNVNKWIGRFGDPSKAGVDPVLWIELIPFAETRNYVQRVVANFMVYRARLGLPQIDVAQVLRAI